MKPVCLNRRRGKNMTDRSPFRVMCDMWGLDVALKTARQLGIEVTEEEIEAETKKYRKMANDLSAMIRSIREGDEND